jgi:hypothetical protein
VSSQIAFSDLTFQNIVRFLLQVFIFFMLISLAHGLCVVFIFYVLGLDFCLLQVNVILV